MSKLSNRDGGVFCEPRRGTGEAPAFWRRSADRLGVCLLLIAWVLPLTPPAGATASEWDSSAEDGLVSGEAGCRGFDDASWHQQRQVEDVYEPGLAGFSLQWADEVSPFRIASTFLLPGSQLTVEAVLGNRDSTFIACATGGVLTPTGARRWSFVAPDDGGYYDLSVSDLTTGNRSVLRVFVLRPYAGEEVLDGYRIGSYERDPLRRLDVYRMPRGLLEVDEDDELLYVSPHFRLGQFLCKQRGGPTRFVLVGERLLLLLEKLLEEVNVRGHHARTFTVMSGYRTPYYNASIGNRTIYSRHLYGDAADIYIDEDQDGLMDDLDSDGRVTESDARVLYEAIDELQGRSDGQPFLGGVGLYGPKPHRGPFVHVDTRGFKARW